MSERIRTLVACGHCGRGYPVRDLRPTDVGWLCKECDPDEAEVEHDCDKEYRADCARCNGVSPGDVGTW